MKKLPLLALLMLSVLSTSILAGPPMPFPVSGEVVMGGAIAPGVEVTITNLGTEETLVVITDATGKFIIDMGGFQEGYYIQDRRTTGDTLEFRLVYNGLTYTKQLVLDPAVNQCVEFQACTVSIVDEAAETPAEPESDTTKIIGLAIAVVILGLMGLYAFNKNKYRWAPGMAGILKYQQKMLGKAVKDKNKKAINRWQNQILKTTNTLAKKYLKKKG